MGSHFLPRVLLTALPLKRCLGLGSCTPRTREVPLPLALVRLRRASFLETPWATKVMPLDLRVALTRVHLLATVEGRSPRYLGVPN